MAEDLAMRFVSHRIPGCFHTSHLIVVNSNLFPITLNNPTLVKHLVILK